MQAWLMGVIIAIVEPQSKSNKSAWPLFFLELSKILEKRRPHWMVFNPHPPDRERQSFSFVDCDGNVTHFVTKTQTWHEINQKKPEFCLYSLIYPCFVLNLGQNITETECALEKSLYRELKMFAQSCRWIQSSGSRPVGLDRSQV